MCNMNRGEQIDHSLCILPRHPKETYLPPLLLDQSHAFPFVELAFVGETSVLAARLVHIEVERMQHYNGLPFLRFPLSEIRWFSRLCASVRSCGPLLEMLPSVYQMVELQVWFQQTCTQGRV